MEEYFHQMRIHPRSEDSFVIETMSLKDCETRESLLSSTIPLSPLKYDMKRRIEDFEQYAFVDFANCRVGGSSLYGASAQEQILFSIIPECCLAIAFCHTMADHQAIAIKGCTRIGTYTGYGGSFRYIGPFTSSQPPSPIEVIAIDASHTGDHRQFSTSLILRDINKAKAGFALTSETMHGIASGKWGCGVFGGDPTLKFIQQWIAASLVGKEVSWSFYFISSLQKTSYELIIN